MRYAAVVDGVVTLVDVEAAGPDRVAVVVGGEAMALAVRGGPHGGLSWQQGGRGHAVHVERRGEVRRVHAGDGHLDVEVLGLRGLSLRRAAAAAGQGSHSAQVRAPMPGRVVAVLVAEGAQVAAGAGLLVVEAMKMENELRAPAAGRVADLRVAVGATVDGGEVLCRIA